MALRTVGDARHIGILSQLTPRASTSLLLLVTGQGLSSGVVLAASPFMSVAR
ncbi:hypothetical protein [Archangium gephyra]|uniref:Permease of the drug/metabolite transporter n=1 Tax=Archangium gephyra TaxID=48 RepID=A0AAC8TE05_9BACT|nr:hypothetical protein [Archangium gephyra]AKJ02507.1 Permease of the drug/metabolite transporter [Archangium gephyra]